MSNNMNLEEILNCYKVGELKELAKASGVTGYSKLKKAELVEIVSKQLETVDVASLDIPDKIKAAMKPAKTEAPKTEKKTPKNTVHKGAPIIGVAPHVMNVMQGKQTPVTPVSRPAAGKKVYPNDPCPCGSGKKYKKCCGRR